MDFLLYEYNANKQSFILEWDKVYQTIVNTLFSNSININDGTSAR